MLEKSILPYFGKLLIVGGLKGLYNSIVDCYSFVFDARRKSHFTLLLTPFGPPLFGSRLTLDDYPLPPATSSSEKPQWSQANAEGSIMFISASSRCSQVSVHPIPGLRVCKYPATGLLVDRRPRAAASSRYCLSNLSTVST